MALSSDINAAGEWLIEQSPDGSYDEKDNYRRADAEIRPQPSDREL